MCVCVDDQQSLHSAGLYNGSDLFIWNGIEVTHNSNVHMSVIQNTTNTICMNGCVC